MKRWTKFAADLALVLAIAATCLAGAVGITLMSSGVFSTAEPAWTTQVPVLGRSVTVNVSGVARLLTAPGVPHVLDGRSLATHVGRVAFRRDGRALVLACAPCSIQHPHLATVPLVLSRVELRVEREDTRVEGRLAIEGVTVTYVANLAPHRIRIQWQLPETDVAVIFRVLATIVPEAGFARIEGTVHAKGVLDLPSGKSSLVFGVNGVEVGGLGTEALQFGWFRMACTGSGGSMHTFVTGDGETPWIALDRMGAYLTAAAIAAEDQRFHEHTGIDATELAALLSDLDGAPRRGASTLTQQLARTLYTGGERTAARKLRELLYALEMERTLGKARVLELYLNTVHWGPGICGARAAARSYFGKHPAQLTPIEAAWLASILSHPHAAYAEQFIPRTPERERAVQVVQQMREFPRGDRRRWASAPLAFAPPRPMRPARTASSSRSPEIAARRVATPKAVAGTTPSMALASVEAPAGTTVPPAIRR